MKAITTEASERQTDGETDIILLSHLLMEEHLKKLAFVKFYLASSNYCKQAFFCFFTALYYNDYCKQAFFGCFLSALFFV